MNVKRLEELKNLLSSIPESKFDLGFWIQGFSVEGKKTEELLGECGTSGCAVGWACTHKPFNDEGLSYENFHSDGEFIPVYNDDLGWDAVCSFFGISYSLSKLLFDQLNYPCDEDGQSIAKPNDVAERLQFILDNKDLNHNQIYTLLKGKYDV